VSFFYTPSQVREAELAPGRAIRIGGLVEPGSVVEAATGEVRFVVTDQVATLPVRYQGDLPDLFREGQGVVAQGAFGPDGAFNASQVLAKHDENYMPPEVARGLEESKTRSLVEAPR
jgi:cytochrome c-type biogenesis protein CcmE